MSNVQTPFRYDYVGSFLRPEKLKQARRQFDEGKIPYAELKVVEDEAITELIGKIKAVPVVQVLSLTRWHLFFRQMLPV